MIKGEPTGAAPPNFKSASGRDNYCCVSKEGVEL